MGLAVFLVGVGLLGLTFKLAFEMFDVPQATALGLAKGQEIDAGQTGGAAARILFRIGLLVIMAIVSSMIANRGIGLYGRSLHPVDKGHPEPLRPAEPEGL